MQDVSWKLFNDVKIGYIALFLCLTALEAKMEPIFQMRRKGQFSLRQKVRKLIK